MTSSDVPHSWEHTSRQNELMNIASLVASRLAERHFGKEPHPRSHFCYGDLSSDPGQLVIWYVFETSAELNEGMRKSGLVSEIDTRTRAELKEGGYPNEVIPKVWVSFSLLFEREVPARPAPDYFYENQRVEQNLRKTQLERIVSAALSRIETLFSPRQPGIRSHVSFGANWIHPRHLVICWVFESEADVVIAEESGLATEIAVRTRLELIEGGYPKEVKAYARYP